MNKLASKYLQKLQLITEAENCPAYLVGGTVRDCLMQRPCVDYDVTAANISKIASLFADQCNLNLVKLDDTPNRETCRVIIDKRLHFDFSAMQGGSIEKDLSQRDFTINAMAVTLKNFNKGNMDPIDFHGGQSDLDTKTVRVLSGPIFESDPLRMLRAFRFAATLEFNIEKDTLIKIEKASPEIKNVARERISYELLTYLGANAGNLKTPISPRLMGNIIPELIPAINSAASDSIIKTWSTTERILKSLDENIAAPEHIFREFSPDIIKFMDAGRRRALVKMAGILHGLDNFYRPGLSPASMKITTVPLKIMKGLRFSNADRAFVDRTLFFQQRALNEAGGFFAHGLKLPRIYNFVKSTADELIPALLLASSSPNAGPGMEAEFNNCLYNIYKFYLNQYLPRQNEPALLDGRDLVTIFRLKPSPLYKTILDSIEEARVLDKINSRKEAEALAQTMITRHEQG